MAHFGFRYYIPSPSCNVMSCVETFDETVIGLVIRTSAAAFIHCWSGRSRDWYNNTFTSGIFIWRRVAAVSRNNNVKVYFGEADRLSTDEGDFTTNNQCISVSAIARTLFITLSILSMFPSVLIGSTTRFQVLFKHNIWNRSMHVPLSQNASAQARASS